MRDKIRSFLKQMWQMMNPSTTHKHESVTANDKLIGKMEEFREAMESFERIDVHSKQANNRFYNRNHSNDNNVKHRARSNRAYITRSKRKGNTIDVAMSTVFAASVGGGCSGSDD